MADLQAKGAERTRTAVQSQWSKSPANRPESRVYLDKEAGFRLAALADGEGHFGIQRINRKPRGRGIHDRAISPVYRAFFIVQLRADDLPFLERMRKATGLGVVRVAASKATPGRNNSPKARWAVERKDECRELVRIFDRYRLWSKKDREYTVWRFAVICWSDGVLTGPLWQELHDELREEREYREAAA